MAKELDPATKAMLTRLANQVAKWQVAAEAIKGRIAAAKAQLKEIAKANRSLERHETDRAVLVVSWPKALQGNAPKVLEVVRKIVDPEDFAAIYPRKFDVKAFGGVLKHHKYDLLKEAVPSKAAKTPTVEVRQVEA